MRIYLLMKRKIERDGLTEACCELLDVFFFAGRLTREEYTELLGRESPQ